ncbi:MAG: dockerin type I repeat-containing protein, partial [bacterium]
NMSYPEGLTLINQSGSSLISQTSGFSGLPQGSFFTSNNTALQINYNGQAGNYTAASSGNDLIVRLSTRYIDVMTQCLTTTANSSFAGGLKFRVVGGAGNGTVVANVPITVILPANVNNSNTASGRFDNANAANRSITVYTDSNGNATVPIWANENPGPFQVNITQADDTSITNYPFMGVIGVAVQQQSRNRSFVRYMDVVLDSSNLTALNANTTNFLANFTLTRTRSASISGGANITDTTNYLANGPSVANIYTTPVGFKIDFGTNGLGNQPSTAVFDGVYQLANKAGATVIPANAPYTFHRLLGDANGDGVVDALDTNLVQTVLSSTPWRYQNASNLMYVNGNTGATSVNPVAAYNWVGDVNGDGKINALDLNLVTFQKGRRVNYTRKVT